MIVRKDPGWRWFIADICRAVFVYESILSIPIIHLSDLYLGGSDHSIVIPYPRAIQKETELVVLASLVAHLKPRTIFEFGTSIGGGTLLLAENCCDAVVNTLNLSPEDNRIPPDLKGNIGVAFKGHACEKRIIQLWGDSTNFDYSPFTGTFDFVFIDAGHDYESVKSDTENALRILSSQGVIVWHDFPSALGVRRYLVEFAKEHRVFRIRDTRLAIFDPRIGQVNTHHQYWGWE